LRIRLLTLLWVLAGPVLLSAQTPPLAKTDQDAIVAFTEKAAVRALNFRQGELASLMQGRADFTSAGWTDFLQHMQGFLDEKGAPTFTSSFVPSGGAVIVAQENGIVHVRIPGTLKQTHDQSSTAYRVKIQIQAGGKPARITRLEQTMCAGSAACR
jgi:hypothetical protein